MKKELILFIKISLFVLILSVFSCNRNARVSSANAESSDAVTASQMPLYHTWLSLKEMDYWKSDPPLFYENPPDEFFPWAGIVSHHILAHSYIDAWFSFLSQVRDVHAFFVISPDHYGIALQPFSLTAGNWDSGFGFVESGREKVLQLAESLEVELDPNVFFMEHGISVLMPYIKKYFPMAEVITIVVNAESEVNTRIGGQLVRVLEKEFDKEGKRNNFLLISSDFSHKENIEHTASNDFQSMLYLKNIDGAFWNMVICDNRMGIYILDRLGKGNLESVILYHTSSYEISNQGEDDITSYFFVGFAGRE